MTDTTEHFDYPIRVVWGDCDPARIAYTGHIPGWAIEAIDGWWEHHLGHNWYEMEIDLGFGTPFVHLSMDFVSPITPRHRLICRVWPVKLGKSSITFRVDGMQDGKLCFKGTFVNVFMKSGTFAAAETTPDIRDLLEPHLRPA